MGQEISDHILAEKLADYFEETLSEEEAKQIEVHFSKCESCTKQARELHAFDNLWERWIAETKRDAQRALMARALAEASEAHPNWKERLKRWHTDWKDKAEAAVQVIKETAESSTYLVTGGLQDLVRPEGRWQFVPATMPTRGPATRRVASNTGREGQAQPLEEGMSARGKGTTIKSGQVIGKQGERIFVTSDGKIDISINLTDAETSPLVLLISLNQGIATRVKELTRTGGALKVQFESIEPGEYLVVFEPVEHK